MPLYLYYLRERAQFEKVKVQVAHSVEKRVYRFVEKRVLKAAVFCRPK